MVWILVADPVRNLMYRQVLVEQQPLRFLHTHRVQIAEYGGVEELPEPGLQLHGIDAGPAGKRGDRSRLVKMLIQVSFYFIQTFDVLLFQFQGRIRPVQLPELQQEKLCCFCFEEKAFQRPLKSRLIHFVDDPVHLRGHGRCEIKRRHLQRDMLAEAG